MNPWLFSTPFIAAFAGWLLHIMASRYIIGTYLIDKQKDIAKSAGAAAQKYFDEHFNIEKKIADPALIEKVMPLIEEHIDDFLNVKLTQEIPMLSMFIGNKLTEQIRTVFVNQLRSLFPQVMAKVAGNLKADLNIQQMITEAIEKKSLKIILQNNLSGELQKFQQLGALNGFIIGCLNVLLFFILK